MNTASNPRPKVPLGRIVITPHAKEVLEFEDILAGIRRHEAGDWGEMEPEDRSANDRAMILGTWILSAYPSHRIRISIITEADRSKTTVLLPENY